MERQASAEVGALLLIVVETRVAGGGCQAERLHLHGNHQPGEQEIRFINNLSLTEELLVENVQSICICRTISPNFVFNKEFSVVGKKIQIY